MFALIYCPIKLYLHWQIFKALLLLQMLCWCHDAQHDDIQHTDTWYSVLVLRVVYAECSKKAFICCQYYSATKLSILTFVILTLIQSVVVHSLVYAEYCKEHLL